MTNLEYIICEAESIGEIDLATRNELLGALYESTALQRNRNFSVDKKKEMLQKIKLLKKDYESKQKVSDSILKKSKTYEVDDPKLADMMINYNIKKKESQKAHSELLKAQKKFNHDCPDRKSKKYYKDDRRAIDKRLDKYGTVESTEVDDLRMEIYERELTGEITVEEREELLDYLDARLSED